MKLLVISDEKDPALWDYYMPGRLDGVDAIISCGDLSPEYLSFLVTMGSVPLFYVHGNHDVIYERRPPEGCDCIDGQVVSFRGYRILGLGGCMRYNRNACQYTEREMRWRIARLRPALARQGGVDLLITHAPARGLGDMDDPCHRGFECFRELLDRYHPLYHCHGHVHLQYVPTRPRTRQYGETTIVNASGKYILELPDRAEKPKKRWGCRLKTNSGPAH